jgi:hypothetical protein
MGHIRQGPRCGQYAAPPLHGQVAWPSRLPSGGFFFPDGLWGPSLLIVDSASSEQFIVGFLAEWLLVAKKVNDCWNSCGSSGNCASIATLFSVMKEMTPEWELNLHSAKCPATGANGMASLPSNWQGSRCGSLGNQARPVAVSIDYRASSPRHRAVTRCVN